MNSSDFTIDTPHLKEAGYLPVLVCALLGAASAVGVSLGGLYGLVEFGIWIWAGILYSKKSMESGESQSFVNLAFNGALVAAAADLANSIVFWVIRILQGSYSPYIAGIISSFIQAAIVGGMAALAWNFYQKNKKV